MKRVIEFLKHRPLASLTILFAATRAVLYTLFPFRIGFLPMLNQLLDIHLLRTDLWNSLWQLHATPPLYNLFIAAIVNSTPENWWPLAFHIVYFAVALGIVLLSYRILMFFKTPWWAAFCTAILMIANPIMFRFEIIPFYTVPLAFLILLSVFFLIKFLETSRKTYIILFLGTPLVILLFRNFFHVIVFYVPILIGAWILVFSIKKEIFKTVLVAGLLFLLIGIAPNVKNQIEYGMFSSSTWQGMQLFSMTYFVPKENIKTLVAEGVVTPLALLPRFQNSNTYYEYYGATPANGHPALHAVYKSTGTNDGNFNNIIYVRTAKEYGENTMAILSRYPEYFLPRFINSVYIFFGVANYRYFDKADEWLIFDGSTAKQVFQFTKYFIQPALLAVVYLLVMWFLMKSLWGAFHNRRILKNENPVLLYSLFLFSYTFAVANVVELGENYTARMPLDPLLLIILVYAIWVTFKKDSRVEAPGIPR